MFQQIIHFLDQNEGITPYLKGFIEYPNGYTIRYTYLMDNSIADARSSLP